MKATKFVLVWFVCFTNSAWGLRAVIGEPLVLEIPGESGVGAKKLCLAKVQHDENIGPFVSLLDEKTHSCSRNEADYQQTNEHFKGGITRLDGPKSDFMEIEDGRKLKYRASKFAAVFSFPVSIPGIKEIHWQVGCLHAVLPVDSAQTQWDDTYRVCKPESPEDGLIPDSKIDKEIEAKGIKCPYPRRCKEREYPLISQAAYTAKVTEARDALAGTHKPSTVKPLSGGGGGSKTP